MLTISAERLTKVATDIFRAAGASAENNECVVSALVGANLAGHDSHGILRIPAYVNAIKNGSLNPSAAPEVVHEAGSTAIVDGGATFGQVGARFAADTANEKAKQTGIAAVTARNCNHRGNADGIDGLAMLRRASGSRGRYDKVQGAVAICQHLDPGRAAVNSRSFRRFLRVHGDSRYAAQSRLPNDNP